MLVGICAEPQWAHSAAQAGFDFMELPLWSTLRPMDDDPHLDNIIAAPLRNLALPVRAFNLFMPPGGFLVGDDRDLLALSRYIDAAARRACQCEALHIGVGSGAARRIPPSGDRAGATRQLQELLAVVALAATVRGIKTSLEPLRPDETNLVNSLGEAETLLRGQSQMGILADTYHLSPSELQAPEAAGLVTHLHVASRQARRVPTTADVAFLRPYMAALKAVGFSGMISVEAGWEDQSEWAEGCEAVRHAWRTA